MSFLLVFILCSLIATCTTIFTVEVGVCTFDLFPGDILALTYRLNTQHPIV